MIGEIRMLLYTNNTVFFYLNLQSNLNLMEKMQCFHLQPNK